ncbi:hypothetical protein ACIA8G_21765 [Lentzea sp. NPDC051213]|uniref:hypothetical protein n=1 Tax=Lentzea sp. NPDC051213 TaxID=3364126 RepID=UPI00379B90B6
MPFYPSRIDTIDTVGDLLDALTEYDPATPLRWAAQPNHPFEYTVGKVVCTPQDAEGDGTERTEEPVVWLGEGTQVGPLPDLATNALEWS